MFTVFAILFTLAGVPLLMSGPARKLTNYNKLGGYLCIIAFILWACVILSLLWQAFAWLWGNAP